MALRRLLLFVLAAPLVWAAACSTAEQDESTAAGAGFGGTGGQPTDAARDRATIDVVAPSDGPEAAAPLSPLCGGESTDCNPDDANSCKDFDAGVSGQGDAADATSLTDSGAEAQSNMLPPPQTGMIDAAYNSTPSANDAAGDSPADSYAAGACRIHRVLDAQRSTDRTAVCEASGSQAVDGPCVSSSDCQPGLACIGDSAAARCLPLCCAGSIRCTTGTFCTEQTLREDLTLTVGLPPLPVPVCVKADACDLAEPYPCPVDRVCKCAEGTACTVVRDDGTTSCVKPGEGLAGESCPCAWGHVCSQATSTCLKLCATSSQNAECGSTGKCQASADLPAGWGVCVGPSDTDGG